MVRTGSRVLIGGIITLCFLLIIQSGYSRLIAGGDCCAQCPNYCFCNATCETSCRAYLCILHPEGCTGSGNKCCLCVPNPQ